MTPRPRPPAPRPDDAALLRYVSGNSPLAESQAIEQWLDADPDLAASVRELDAAWSKASPPAIPWRKAGVWDRISDEIHARPAPAPPRRVLRGLASVAASSRRTYRSIALAATLLIAVGVAVHRAERSPVADEEVIWREVVTERAQQAVLDLPDGSRVTLAADSRLRIPSTFDQGTALGRRRELYLEGRAYFTVTHDTTRPFLVHTETASTEDIGTAFVITAYPEMRTTQVVVTEGAVALHQRVSSDANASHALAPKPLMLLTRGDLATLDASGTATLRRNVEVEHFLSWTRGLLSFDGALLRDVIPELERWYDVEIRISDPALGNRRVTGRLQSEPSAQVADRLALILGVRVQRTGRVILLSP